MSNSFIAKRNDGAVMVLINLPDDEYEEAVVSLSKAEDTDRFESFHFLDSGDPRLFELLKAELHGKDSI